VTKGELSKQESSALSGINYAGSGVNVAHADETKKALKEVLDRDRPSRVLNSVGAFASLIDISNLPYQSPVLVMKTEEPGTKQKLAFASDRVESLCYDLVNHLINDIAVMGAKPLAVQDCIVCGQLDGAVVKRLVTGMAEACRAQGASLVGGETSEQPGVVSAGLYILSSSVVGIVERNKIVDGSKVKEGDIIFAVPSSGVHTNGYSLVRKLLDRDPALATKNIGTDTFFNAIMEPHRCYALALVELAERELLSSMAHITGGGIAGNVNRVMPDGLSAVVDLSTIKILSVFKAIRDAGQITDADMLAAFNIGVGLVGSCRPEHYAQVEAVFAHYNDTIYSIGSVESGSVPVQCKAALNWS